MDLADLWQRITPVDMLRCRIFPMVCGPVFISRGFPSFRGGVFVKDNAASIYRNSDKKPSASVGVETGRVCVSVSVRTPHNSRPLPLVPGYLLSDLMR